MLIGGGSGFASVNASFLLDALPAFLRVDPGSSSARSIARTLSALKEEADAGQIGGDLVAGKLAEILIIEAVRSYISSAPVANVGWITALGDARVAKAIRLMHDDVARRWTIDALAREIGMSRSALTLRFSQRVGRAPMDYLTRWRMVLAQRHLANGGSVSDVALAVGYSSQSAFAHAFKRVTGHTPRGV